MSIFSTRNAVVAPSSRLPPRFPKTGGAKYITPYLDKITEKGLTQKDMALLSQQAERECSPPLPKRPYTNLSPQKRGTKLKPIAISCLVRGTARDSSLYDTQRPLRTRALTQLEVICVRLICVDGWQEMLEFFSEVQSQFASDGAEVLARLVFHKAYYCL
eukprot:6091079-Amphidinium_carterae.1